MLPLVLILSFPLDGVNLKFNASRVQYPTVPVLGGVLVNWLDPSVYTPEFIVNPLSVISPKVTLEVVLIACGVVNVILPLPGVTIISSAVPVSVAGVKPPVNVLPISNCPSV